MTINFDDIIAVSKRATGRATMVAMSAMSPNAAVRKAAQPAIRSMMNHMRPGMYGAAIGAGTFMVGNATSDVAAGRTPTIGGMVGAGFQGAVLGGLGGAGYGGWRGARALGAAGAGPRSFAGTSARGNVKSALMAHARGDVKSRRNYMTMPGRVHAWGVRMAGTR